VAVVCTHWASEVEERHHIASPTKMDFKLRIGMRELHGSEDVWKLPDAEKAQLKNWLPISPAFIQQGTTTHRQNSM
jgi:hypothetical protein